MVLHRSSKKKIVGGVCGGISELLNINVIIVRLIFLLFFIIKFTPTLCVYVISCLILSEEGKKSPLMQGLEDIKDGMNKMRNKKCF